MYSSRIDHVYAIFPPPTFKHLKKKTYFIQEQKTFFSHAQLKHAAQMFLMLEGGRKAALKIRQIDRQRNRARETEILYQGFSCIFLE